jgi:hypothetical protein
VVGGEATSAQYKLGAARPHKTATCKRRHVPKSGQGMHDQPEISHKLWNLEKNASPKSAKSSIFQIAVLPCSSFLSGKHKLKK